LSTASADRSSGAGKFPFDRGAVADYEAAKKMTPEQGREYFQMLPKPVENPIAPDFVAKGIVLLQAQKRLVSATPALGAGPALAKARG
jgi:hypothetical protein